MENTFTIDQKILSSVLSSMQPICSKRTTLDTTSSILFNTNHKELIIKSTDLEISLQYSCFIKDSNLDEGQSFLVSGKRLFDLVKELDGEIQFNINNNQVSLQAGPAQLSLNIKNAQEFPPFPERIENIMQLDNAFLLEMLDKVAFLIPQNNSNPALNGLYLEVSNTEIKMTATDGHCLVQTTSGKYKLEEQKTWLLPRRAIFELKKILENVEDQTIFLGTCGNQLVFSGTSFNFFTKLLADPFPEYASILDRKDFNQGTVSRINLVKSLRRSTCLLSGQFIATRFDFTKSALSISLQNKEVGSMQENLSLEEFVDKEITIRFYAPYLLNGLQALSEDKINFHLNNQSRPVIFESKEREINFIYLVMPVSPSYN
ncbi:MAG: DNA polymerase III subunit beta [Candidatus Babeliales bacterium]|nr:DNA polymerase III subunit beta [Candidatus Babeliales bacterium]